MSNVKLPAQLQEQLLRLQQLQQTLQAVINQRQQLELENSEIDQALDELVKMEDKSSIYKSIGSLLVKSEKHKVIDELRERKDTVQWKSASWARIAAQRIVYGGVKTKARPDYSRYGLCGGVPTTHGKEQSGHALYCEYRQDWAAR